MKPYIVTFNRGSGSCFDEVIFLIFAEKREDAEIKTYEYSRNRFSGWNVYIEEPEFDVDGWCTISARYG